MKAVLILVTVAVIMLPIAIVIVFRFQKGGSELLNSKDKNIYTQTI